MTRKRPIVHATCSRCGLRLVAELHPDGRLFASRHPERVSNETIACVCFGCIETTGGPTLDDARV